MHYSCLDYFGKTYKKTGKEGKKEKKKKTKKQGGKREKREKPKKKHEKKRKKTTEKKKLKKPGETTEISSENEIKRGGKKNLDCKEISWREINPFGQQIVEEKRRKQVKTGETPQDLRESFWSERGKWKETIDLRAVSFWSEN